jgi:hypothetical protein
MIKKVIYTHGTHLKYFRLIKQRSSQIVEITLFLTFAIFLTILKSYHEPWRDELQEYGFVSRRPGALSIFQEFFSGGYLPPYSSFYSFFSYLGGYSYKKWFVWFLLIFSTFLFISLKEIKFRYKAILLTSPYILYEWSTIDRNYTLIFAVSLILLKQISLRVRSEYILVSLSVLNFLGLWGMFISVLVLCTLSAFNRSLDKLHYYWFSFTLILASLPFVLNINKGYGGPYEGRVDFTNPLDKLVSTAKNLFILLFGEAGQYPHTWVRIWPSHFPVALGIFTVAALLISGMIFAFTINSKLSVLLTSSAIIYFVWTAYFYPGAQRHWFFLPFSWLIITFVFKLVSSKTSIKENNFPKLKMISSSVLVLILSTQVLSQVPYSAKNFLAEIRLPFSSVNQIVLPNSNKSVLLIYPDYLGVTFLAQKKTEALFLEGNYVGDFRGFRNSRAVVPSDLYKRCFDKDTNLFLLTNQDITRKIIESGIGKVIQTSDPAIVSEEGNISLVEINRLCLKSEWSKLLKAIEQ